MNDQAQDKGFIANNKKKLAAAGAAALISGGVAFTVDFSDKSSVGGDRAEVINKQVDDHSIKTNDITSGGDVNIGGQK